MPISRKTDVAQLVKKRPTLTGLIEMRRAIPPTTDFARASLSERFLLPPFSVLDARQGYWQKRKKMWLALGILSELGRGNTPSTSARVGPEDAATYRPIGGRANGLLGESEQARSHYRANATPGGSPLPAATLKDGRTQRGDGRGRPLATTEGSGGPGDLAAELKGRKATAIPGGGTGKNSGYMFKTSTGDSPLKDIQADDLAKTGAKNLYGAYDQDDDTSRRNAAAQPQSGTSIFDPVICELAYRWFTPVGGRVLDPFAGGSVRGIVAARLGRSYAGVDLRQEQADANQLQANTLCPGADLRWAVGDSKNITQLLPGEYDFVFSCPPYADLERYSDDPRDLSTMEYDRFIEVYRGIIVASCAMLKQDRFACFVVGDVRDRASGNYRNFVGDTVQAFRDAGLELYNDAVLVTAVGSLPIRVGRQFKAYRKLGKTHQNVLVFIKGDAGRAATFCGDVDIDDLEMPECTVGQVAICAKDVQGTVAENCLMLDDKDVMVVNMDTIEAALLCDVVCGQARTGGVTVPRAWVGTSDGWQRIGDKYLTYLVGNEVYLNGEVFEGAAKPADQPPTARKLAGAE